MYLAIGVDPTKLTAAMSGWARMASTACLSPWTTENTPSGRPARFHNSARNSEAEGSFSLGLRTNVLPHAMALAHIHSGTMAGKLNGVIPATTPRGWRMEYTSTSVDACSLNPPFISCGTPHANSTFSRPRAISPAASACTLPCSAVMMFASSSRLSCSRARKANSTDDRLDSGARRHCSAAILAPATAASTSAAVARSTSALCTPVAGLYTGEVRPEVPATVAPSIQWEMRAVMHADYVLCVGSTNAELLQYKRGRPDTRLPRRQARRSVSAGTGTRGGRGRRGGGVETRPPPAARARGGRSPRAVALHRQRRLGAAVPGRCDQHRRSTGHRRLHRAAGRPDPVPAGPRPVGRLHPRPLDRGPGFDAVARPRARAAPATCWSITGQLSGRPDPAGVG